MQHLICINFPYKDVHPHGLCGSDLRISLDIELWGTKQVNDGLWIEY